MKKSRGFSLMETIAALALLALLLLGVTAALQTLTRSTRAGMARSQRLDEVRAAQGYLRHALANAMPYPWSLAHDRSMIVFQGDASELVFVAPGPGYLAASGLQLQKLQIIGDGDQRRLEAAFAPLALRGGSPIVPADPETLVSDVVSLRFVYNGMDDQGHLLGWQERWPYATRLPTMVGVELVLKGGVRWPVLAVPLRMDARAVNGREGLARLTTFAKP
ncbi:prepilin-type N-terminal cleavage/methylation domain-containing protein [Luteibacter sp. UNCMF366Tsu5.1]|uniref:prepilin-type N-terminal cleavage/methylation domain-containing protein n=1 Tax=Luteibacter sp. UNCMF366Tsu5.1 TaxID=1502758 RepID=UPI000908C5DA|nr:prepilin-type N-terminal cleavage/methylation domain-containing protein [Luteibacter sp. UNCMF366Tsu5.1]SFW28816.1 general secretion pathway protein J [Luteibacter sp. UNCMF366Tsu5.1]